MSVFRFACLPFARIITALTGYLRPRPDPSLEQILRDAFDRFDRDLEIISLACRDRPLTDPVCAAKQASAQCRGWNRHDG